MMTPRLPAEWLQIEPLEQAHALPAPFYTDPALYQSEQGLVFGRSWQLVAHVDALRDPGDHIVTEVAGKPIIVVRGQDGELRGFHNVCRHRAGPLALCDGKGAKALHCKYHGWTYTLEGQLRSAPEMQGACDFQVSDIRLPPVRVAVWAPLVFVSLSDDAPPFEQVFAGISERVAPNRVQTLRFHNRISYDIACNWKVYVDNFLEGYHLPHVHPGLSKLLDYRSYQTELAEWHSLQYSPLDDAANFYGDGGGAFYYFIYPNIMLNCLPGRMQTNRIVPLGVDRCRVEFDYYYPVATDADELARREQDQQFSHEIQDEDIGICLAVQKGLQSGSYHAGRLCPKREAGVKHFQDLLKVAYRHLL